jgi:hypothetical protein
MENTVWKELRNLCDELDIVIEPEDTDKDILSTIETITQDDVKIGDKRTTEKILERVKKLKERMK